MSNKSHQLSRYKANTGKNRILRILKILVSNSKQFRVYGIFKKLQIDDDKGGPPNTTIS